MSEGERLMTLENGDCIIHNDPAIIVEFSGKRRVLATTTCNGGEQENLKAVFNFQCNYHEYAESTPDPLPYEGFYEQFIRNHLKMDPKDVTGLSTFVPMEHVAICTEKFEGLAVTAAATASLEVNGGRVGDPAIFCERPGIPNLIKIGTINILLHFNANMLPGCLARSMLTATEAKSAAIAELMGESLYSHGIATGSGTDGMIVVSDAESDFVLTYAGKHSKLGEMIGRTVHDAVRKALKLHMNLTPENQHSALRRLHRYGLQEEEILKYAADWTDGAEASVLREKLHRLDGETSAVLAASLYAHLMDQMDWKLISPKEAQMGCRTLLNQWAKQKNIALPEQMIEDGTRFQSLKENFARCFARILISETVAHH